MNKIKQSPQIIIASILAFLIGCGAMFAWSQLQHVWNGKSEKKETREMVQKNSSGTTTGTWEVPSIRIPTQSDVFMQSFSWIINGEGFDAKFTAYGQAKKTIGDYIANGSGGIFYEYPGTDYVVPSLFVCETLTTAKNMKDFEGELRNSIRKYQSVFTIQSKSSENPDFKMLNEHLQSFISGKIPFEAYQKLVSPLLQKYEKESKLFSFFQELIDMKKDDTVDCAQLSRKYF